MHFPRITAWSVDESSIAATRQMLNPYSWERDLLLHPLTAAANWTLAASDASRRNERTHTHKCERNVHSVKTILQFLSSHPFQRFQLVRSVKECTNSRWNALYNDVFDTYYRVSLPNVNVQWNWTPTRVITRFEILLTVAYHQWR